MRGKGKTIFAILLGVMFVGYLLVTGIYDLVNTKDKHTVNVDSCIEILEIEHSINGLIPVGKDHYYLGVDDSDNACIIKASKGWYKRNFNEQGECNTSGGLDITVLAKKINDYDVSRELLSRVSQIEGLNYAVSPEYALEMDYKINAIGKLVLLALGAALAIVVIRISNSSEGVSGTTKKLILLAGIVFLVLLLKTII